MGFAVEGTIDCAGFEHRLLVDGEQLRALDHEDEAAQVFDALAGASPCSRAVQAWHELVHSFDNRTPVDKPSFDLVHALMPDHDDERWYVSHLAEVRREPIQLEQMISMLKRQQPQRDLGGLDRLRRSALDRLPLLDLPENLRCAVALTWVGHALDTGVVRDPVREHRLRRAVAQCWESFRRDGLPSSEARRRLIWDVRAHRWPGPP